MIYSFLFISKIDLVIISLQFSLYPYQDVEVMYDLFEMRAFLHQKACKHKTIMIIEYM